MPSAAREPSPAPWWRAELTLPSPPALVPAAALAAVVAALFFPLLRGRVLFDRDIAEVYHPQAEAFYRAVREGAWPLWNPCLSFGEPMLANPSMQVLYPTTWLLLVLTPWTWYTAHVLGHFLLAAVGLYALSRRLGQSRLAATVAASVWILSGPLVSLVFVWHHLAGACWLPWVVLAGVRAVASRTL